MKRSLSKRMHSTRCRRLSTAKRAFIQPPSSWLTCGVLKDCKRSIFTPRFLALQRQAHMSYKKSYTDLEVLVVIAPESIAEILGLGAAVRTVGELESAVSAGLPKRSLERLSARLYDDRKTASAYKFKVEASGKAL